jgi:hypothetical protein
MNAAYTSRGPHNVADVMEPLGHVTRDVTDRPDGPWKLPEPWTPRTRPPLLGKPTERVSHSFHRPSSSLRIDMRSDRKLRVMYLR